MAFWPLASSTPTTFIGTRLTRMVWPSGEAPANSSLTTVWPMMATLAGLRDSRSENLRPSASVRSRATKISAVEPTTVLDQLRPA